MSCLISKYIHLVRIRFFLYFQLKFCFIMIEFMTSTLSLSLSLSLSEKRMIGIICGENHLCLLSLQEVMRIRHDFECCVGCCWCATDSDCGYEIQIEAPLGNVLGYAKQQYVTLSLSVKHFSFKSSNLYL